MTFKLAFMTPLLLPVADKLLFAARTLTLAAGVWLAIFVWPVAAELTITSSPSASPDTTSIPRKLIIPDTSEAFRIPQSYFTGLLRKALVNGANGRPVPLLLEQPFVEQGRATSELLRGRLIDVYWMGTNKKRETELRAIPIPLSRGLLGFRRFAIHRDKIPVFDRIRTREDLISLRACQGSNWPDTAIMRASGLSVRELANIDTVYRYLANGTCDYFPRGHYEIEYELAERASLYPHLVVYDGLMLYYPFAMYFFVSHDNEELGKWIEQGLERMIDTGEFLAFMQQHPLTASSFPLARPNSRIIAIPNQEMEGRLDYKNQRYWFQLEDITRAKKTNYSLSR